MTGQWRQAGAFRSLLALASRIWPWLPVAFAAAYTAALLATLQSVVHAIYLSSDTVSAPYVVDLYMHAGGGANVVLGNIPWYTAFWFEWLTRGLPEYRTLWELAPWLAALAGVALVAWSAGKVAGRWAGAMVAIALGCSGAALLPLQFSWSIHAMAYVHVCVLGAFVVLLASTSGCVGPSRWAHVTALTGMALFTGAGLASDPLVGVAGLAPFVLAGGVVAWGSTTDVARRIVGSIFAVAAGSVVVALLAAKVMQAAGIVALPFPIAFSPYDQLLKHAGLLWESVTVLLNGDFGGAAVSASGLLAFACAVAVSTAMYVCARCGRSSITAVVRARHSRQLRDPQHAARTSYMIFWIASALILSAAFVLSTVPVNVENKRYVVTVAYAVVAVAVVAAERWQWARAVVALAACLLVTGSITSLLRNDIRADTNSYPGSGPALALRQLTQREHLIYGYAGYWDAAPLTWQMNSAAEVYPLSACDGGEALCPFPFHRISTWYRPRANTRTFLVIDSNLVVANGFAAPPAALGAPEQTAKLGRLTVYIYPYDIASRLHSA